MTTTALPGTGFLLSTRTMARLAGVLYIAAVAAAVLAEFILPGRLPNVVAIAIPVACYAGVMLLLFAVLRGAGPRLALFAVLVGLIGLGFDALRWHPEGISPGMVLHGIFCLLLGGLFLRSGLVPRVLGVLMACAGVDWLLYLFPLVTNLLAPWNSYGGLLAEGLPMLWLLFAGAGAWGRAGDRFSRTRR